MKTLACRASVVLSLRRFYYVFLATRERVHVIYYTRNNNNMKESATARARTSVIIDVGGRGKYTDDAVPV